MTSKPSKEYSKVEYEYSNQKGKKQDSQNTDYIKSLYKKYLGKENGKSDKKQKMESGIIKNLFSQ